MINLILLTFKSQIPVSSLTENQQLVGENGNKLVKTQLTGWIHKNEENFYVYLEFSGPRMAKPLHISDEHLIYRTDCAGTREVVRAERIRTGDCLIMLNGEKTVEVQVTQIGRRKMKGAYAPLTSSGNLVVNDILVSSYTHIENEALQRIMYGYIFTVKSWLGGLSWFSDFIFDYCTGIVSGAIDFLSLSFYFVR